MATSTKNPQDGTAHLGGDSGQDSKLESGKVVVYVGSADVREISKAAWDNVGVSDQEMVRWNAKNRWMVPVNDLTDAAVAYCSDDDEGFALKDAPVDK